VSALKVDGGIDSGDIYIKEDLNISLGSAEEIFINLSNIIFYKMIPKILEKNLIPKKQEGEVVQFKRRKPISLNKLYDFIRMLDAEGYPNAFIKLDTIKIEFSEVHLKSNKLVGRFEAIEDE